MAKKKAFVDGEPVHCPTCNHYLGHENIMVGSVAFYCRYCKDYVQIYASINEQEIEKSREGRN